jgi:hypothetical protein
MKMLLTALCVAAFGCRGADAQVVNITYTGTVASGYDGAGLFSGAWTDLSGYSFKATYKFDTSVGMTAPGFALGGTAVGAATPSLGASITINGSTVLIAGSIIGYFNSFNTPSSSQQYTQAQDSGVYLINKISYGGSAAFGLAPPSSFDDDVSEFTDASSFGDGATYLNLLNNHLTVSYAAEGETHGVPEPASWAMMVLGFGAMGTAMRRRSKAAELASAD